ncbi:MAG: phosphoenolpyruvate--protein phosphotransferase [Lachnospiraceae bacterium]|nr:phosphoenolpyruvate--protein phosphotransferase [Lachnospiraceae bacterium]
MVELKGKGVSGGIAIGKLAFVKRDEISVKRTRIENTQKEMERFETAKEISKEQLQSLYEKAVKEVGESSAQIFAIHQALMDDPDYNDSVDNIIHSQCLNAEYAVAVTSDNFADMFAAMEDEYMRERAADIRDISNRIMRNLQQSQEEQSQTEEKHIICADDLAPSETVQMDKSKVLAFCTKFGSSNSHTAILARTMNLPAVIGLGEELLAEYNGKEAIVDGSTGTIYIEPEQKMLEEMRRQQQAQEHRKELLKELKGKENVTLNGQKIKVFANVGGLSDIGQVLANDAGGIGLFRSEFLYLESSDYPSEETQFSTYRQILEKMAGKKVIIRTLDIGADKQIDYFHLDKEENPALGFRAIRICLTRPEIFKTQLRALYRASVYGNLGIMFPMIISLEEIHKIKQVVSEVKEELKAEGLPLKEDVELGIMIETPAAVMVSDMLAKEVDFFSVGTNDLTQYTLAIDRQNPKLESFCDTHHPALLRMIEFAADNAHKHGAWIGICGELGGDLELTEQFLAMGIDELSVSPSLVLPLREKIRSTDMTTYETAEKKLRLNS